MKAKNITGTILLILGILLFADSKRPKSVLAFLQNQSKIEGTLGIALIIISILFFIPTTFWKA